MNKERIARLLPEIFQRTRQSQPDVLGAFLGVMEVLQEPDEAALLNLDQYLDPRETLDAWLPFLAAWVDMDRFLDHDGTFPGGTERLRALILAALRISNMRGTRQGLIAFLETATGLKGFRIEDADAPPYNIKIYSPARNGAFSSLDDDQYCDWLNDLIRAEKPAYVTCELHIQRSTVKTARRAAKR